MRGLSRTLTLVMVALVCIGAVGGTVLAALTPGPASGLAVNAFEVSQTGTIYVNSTPEGAGFSIHGPKNYNNQTAPWSTDNAPAGDYTISWGNMPGYTTPLDDTQTLEDGGSITFTGNYVQQVGTINVNSNVTGATFSLSGVASYSETAPWTKSDAPVGSYTISWGEIDGYAKPSNQTQSLTDNGTITFTGNYADIGAPAIYSVRYTDLKATSVTITWATSEPASSQVEYGLTTGYGSFTTLDETPVLSHSVELTGLIPKTGYHFRVKSTDASGNPAQSGDYAFLTADNDAPVISNVTATNVTGTEATITWTTDDPAEGGVEYGESLSYGESVYMYVTQVTDHSIILTGLNPQTTYHYKVKSRDASLVWSESGDFTFTTVDINAPTVSGVVATDISATAANIIWTTNESATTLVEYGTTASYGSTTIHDTKLVTSHKAHLAGLEPQTTYHYRVKSRDAAGLWAESEDRTFTTTDINAPVISNVSATSITGTDAAITWTTDDAAESQVEYGTSASYGMTTAPDTNRVTKHTVYLTDLSPQVTYHYKVKSRDASGLWAESVDYTFTTGADPGGIPPTIVLVKAFDMTGSGATIAWETNREATSQVEYGLTTEYGKTTVLDMSLNRYHRVDLKGLKPNKTYHYRVISRDAFGNQAQSEDQTFDTTIGKAPSPNLPIWAWAVIGTTVALVVGAMVIREV